MKGVLTSFAVAAVLAQATVFVLFLADSNRLGGSALNGGESAGRYWVADHGRRTEVTAEEFRRSRWLGIAFFAGAPFNVAALGYLLFTRVMPRLLYRRGEDALAAAERRIRDSGPAVAEATTGGSIAWANFGGPLLRVSVHPGGILVKPLWMTRFGIDREHVTSVTEKKVLFRRFVEIEHRSPDVRSPIRIEAKGDALSAALLGLAPHARRG